MSNDTDLAWMAGAFEGEGCFAVYMARNKYIRARVAVHQKDKEFLKPFMQWKGLLYYREGSRNPVWCWEIGIVEHAKAFIEAILPFMKTRRKQALLFLQLCEEFIPIKGTRDRDKPEIEVCRQLIKQIQELAHINGR